MSKEILLNVTATETRLALVAAGTVQEIAIEQDFQRSLVGNIYKARVERVLQGLEAAFVDIGLPQMAFLQLRDIPAGIHAVSSSSPPLSLQQGHVLLVQVIKDPHDTKGARVSACLALPSRYAVWVPQGQGVALSHRIEEADRRMQLQQSLSAMTAGQAGGWIIRTAAAYLSDAQFQQQVSKLQAMWRHLQQQATTASTGSLLWQEWSLPHRFLRDYRDQPLPAVKVDCAATLAELQHSSQEWMPEWYPAIQLYSATRPIFERYAVEKVLQQALSRKVNLPSGGQLIFDETEAMTTIDVNTASFVGQDFAATALQTNLEAATVIAAQLQLRRMGGIIIIDFIDMVQAKARSSVRAALMAALAQDPIKTKVSDVSDFGLVTLTRKRTEKSLRQLLYTECPTCTGCGQLKSVQTVACEIIRAVRWYAANQAGNTLTVLASMQVADYLLNDVAATMQSLGVHINRTITIHAEPTYAQEEYQLT